MSDKWNPDQYERFKDQRARPFHDLLALVEPQGVARAVDLGCGTGELTRELHRRLGATETLGLDGSAAMLAKAAAFAGEGLRFEHGLLEDWRDAAGVDLIFANAALQWSFDHPTLLARLRDNLKPGGQLAVQVPANHDHPSHLIAAEVAAEPEFAAALRGYTRKPSVLPLAEYAERLDALGFADQRVEMRVYGHPLPSSAGVVEWVKGTLLTDYEKRLPAALFPRFVARYAARIGAEFGDGPYFYAFKRILFRARRPA